MANAVPGLLSVAASGIGGFFGFKNKQAEVITHALDVVQDINATEDARMTAAAQIIAAEARSESWLTRNWRPITLLGFTILLFSFFFGYSPPNVTQEMIMRIFDIVEVYLLAGMGLRTTEKVMREISIGAVIKKFIDKKLG